MGRAASRRARVYPENRISVALPVVFGIAGSRALDSWRGRESKRVAAPGHTRPKATSGSANGLGRHTHAPIHSKQVCVTRRRAHAQGCNDIWCRGKHSCMPGRSIMICMPSRRHPMALPAQRAADCSSPSSRLHTCGNHHRCRHESYRAIYNHARPADSAASIHERGQASGAQLAVRGA